MSLQKQLNNRANDTINKLCSKFNNLTAHINDMEACEVELDSIMDEQNAANSIYEEKDWKEQLKSTIKESIDRIYADFFKNPEDEEEFGKYKKFLKMMVAIHNRKPYDTDIRLVFEAMKKTLIDKMSALSDDFKNCWDDEKFTEASKTKDNFIKIASMVR